MLAELAEYEPTGIGTPPLGIDIESSDIDIACTATDLEDFESSVSGRFAAAQDFSVEHVSIFPAPAVRAAFLSHGWEIELFCQTLSIPEQYGVRHFQVEKRLLEIDSELKEKVLYLKRSGLKTEPAFATLLRLDGDPYEAMLCLEKYSDQELALLVANAFSDSSQ